MSASREKKKRKETYQATGGKSAQKKSGGMSRGKVVAITAVVAVIALGLLTLSLFRNGTLNPIIPAVTVGSETYNTAELNYYYNTAIQQYSNAAAEQGIELTQMGLDLSAPLDKQPYPSEENPDRTFKDFFKQQAVYNLTAMGSQISEAKQTGYQMSDEDMAMVDTIYEQFATQAAGQGKSFGEFLVSQYGQGVTPDVIKKIMTDQQYADSFKKSEEKKYTFTDDEINKEYETNKNDIDTVTYRSYLIEAGKVPSPSPSPSASPDTSAEPPAEDNTLNLMPPEINSVIGSRIAQLNADAFKSKVASGATFNDTAIEFAPEADKASLASGEETLNKDQLKANAGELGDWLFDPARVPNEIGTVYSNDNGAYYAVTFMNRTRPEYQTVNVRHILAEINKAGDTATDAEKQEAHDRAQTWLDEWLSGDKTEESFAALATKNTQDTMSAPSGGLYEKVAPGQMVESFNDWCFDTTRKTGDTGLVDSDYGTHVMYFIGKNGPYWRQQVSDQLASDKYSTDAVKLEGKYPATENGFGMSLVG